jgi:hypothetical protein
LNGLKELIAQERMGIRDKMKTAAEKTADENVAEPKQ